MSTPEQDNEQLVAALKVELDGIIKNWKEEKKVTLPPETSLSVSYKVSLRTLRQDGRKHQPPSVMRPLTPEDWGKILSLSWRSDFLDAITKLHKRNNNPLPFDQLFRDWYKLVAANKIFKDSGLPYRFRQQPGVTRTRDGYNWGKAPNLICVLPGH